ncbi:TPA: hypothetical protein ACPVXC_005036 [Vibrio parahaemolyticus]
MVMKLMAVIWFLAVAMVSTFALADTPPRKVVECTVSQTTKLSISIDQDKEGLHFKEFIANRSQLSQWIRPQDYHVRHYRALVDEKSLEFSIGERVILVSEYFSEEFNGVQRTLSVTFRQSGQTEYFECEEGSISNLVLLFKESTE